MIKLKIVLLQHFSYFIQKKKIHLKFIFYHEKFHLQANKIRLIPQYLK